MAVSSSDTAFLTMVKSMPYRGAREEWSNGYHLDIVPSSDSDWSALAQFVWNMEANFLDTTVQWERATGHTPGTPPVLAWEFDAGVVGEGGPPGFFSPGTSLRLTPGDTAGWVRWLTDKKNSRGKPIYFRNYYHRMYTEVDADTIFDGQHALLLQLANAWQVGISANGKTFRRSGPHGGSPQDHKASIYTTTRTLERRGKRKKPAVGSSSSSGLDSFLEKVAAGVLAKGLYDLALAGA